MKRLISYFIITITACVFSQESETLAFLNDCHIMGKKIPKAFFNKVSINFDNLSYNDALSELSQSGQLRINYINDQLPAEETITLQLDDVTTLEALVSIVKNSGMSIEITNAGQVALMQGNGGGSASKHKATSVNISGKVMDKATGDPLPGANIIIEGTSLGTATNIEGEYTIVNVPAGNYTLVVSYIGYKKASQDVFIMPNRTAEVDFSLVTEQIQGDEVVITAQAAGQIQAMNQQVSAKTVTNVVSSKQIQELPEANAAEAVGRLPGVSLERSGGEGSKVVIRGMAAKYSLIQIDGVNMTATGQDDRSTDLSMISPYMLEGIELTKSVMANQEATATGGIVNFRIKKAPVGPSFNIITQGGYNSLRETYKDYKISAGASNRFFSNALGVYAQIDYEEKDNSSQQLGSVSFDQENETAPVTTNSMQLKDIFRNVQRIGGALVLDYSSPTTEIKTSNFYSHINRETTEYVNNYGFETQSFSIGFTDVPKRWLTVWTNSLQLDHRWNNWEFNTAFSHSFSENVLPLQISSSNGNSPDNPFPTDRKSNYNVNLDPETIPDRLAVDMNDAAYFMYMGSINHTENESNERDLAGELDISYNFNITDQINVKLSFGGKYKHKTKEYDTETLTTNSQALDIVYDRFEPELSQRTKDAWERDTFHLYLYDFFDQDYDRKAFFDGRYQFSPVLDKEKFRIVDKVYMSTFDPENKAFKLIDYVLRDYVYSTYYDYHGKEDYHAFYLMSEINLGPNVLIIPGVRYEDNRTEYTGYRGNRLGVQRDWRITPIDTVTKVRNNDFFLPMIQVLTKPEDWLTVKMGYTQTLQRPNYNNIMPGWVIYRQGQIYNLSNFRLRPEHAQNWDVQFSLHSNKIGLFSVGGFYKIINDMIFWTGEKAITDTSFFELPSLMYRNVAAWATNNENKAFNYGYEVEWQSNFWYLPGLLRGLVMNVNYTRNKSKAEYLRTRIETITDPVTWKSIKINKDTTYTSPMIQQPNHLLNLTLGYDIKGFSIRWAMRYKSHIFTSNNWYEELRGYSTDFYRYDLSVRQKLPVKGLEFFLNINNLTDEREHNIINHMNFTSYLEEYGRNGNAGLRYQF